MNTIKIELIKLPFEINALEPYMSKETIEFHHNKHLKTYVDNLNNLLYKNDIQIKSDQELYKIIRDFKEKNDSIYNNASQIFNHNFFFLGLSPKINSKENIPKGELLILIQRKWGNFENFKKEFSKIAIGVFGSGWAWLIKNKIGNLEIISTLNGDSPLTEKEIPLLTCDVWEHAYYIDYRNSRPNYLDAFWNIVNWEFVEENFSKERIWDEISLRLNECKPNF
jgi:Fe-Mn family superoxide dismutase